MSYDVSNHELREHGYLTIDEFVDRLLPGLKEYLYGNWGRGNKLELHHPEDLFSNASIYLDVALHLVADFGVNKNYASGNRDEISSNFSEDESEHISYPELDLSKEPPLGSVIIDKSASVWQRHPSGWSIAGGDGSWSYTWSQLKKELRSPLNDSPTKDWAKVMRDERLPILLYTPKL